MDQAGPQNPYESYCYACNVSAPAEARTCIHCGGRMSRQRGVPARPAPLPYSGEEDDLEMPRRLGAVSPMTVIWILLLLAGSLYRICA